MHPIERLRYVARASSADQRLLVRETAGALRGLQFEPAGLVIACRRIVERHPTSGPLWWFCASLLTSARPFEACNQLASEVEHDPTPDHLVDLLPDNATVCVVGWPDLVGDAVMRRGDIRVLAVDADDEGRSFVRRLERWAARLPRGAWVEGRGWTPSDFPQNAAHKQYLDAAFPDRPVFIIDRDGHQALANSVALRMARVTAATKDPAQGVIERGPGGVPTGLLKESASGLVSRLIPPPGRADIARRIHEETQAAASHGITMVQEASRR
ncbi:MAG: amidohydrolase family protein, partial [Gemmatimonas sp.]